MSRALKIYVFCSLAFAVAVPSLMLAIIFDFPATNAWDYCDPRPDNSGEIDFGTGHPARFSGEELAYSLWCSSPS